MPLETREIKLFWRDIPGFRRDIPGVPEKFEKKKFGFDFRSLSKGALMHLRPFCVGYFAGRVFWILSLKNHPQGAWGEESEACGSGWIRPKAERGGAGEGGGGGALLTFNTTKRTKTPQTTSFGPKLFDAYTRLRGPGIQK